MTCVREPISTWELVREAPSALLCEAPSVCAFTHEAVRDREVVLVLCVRDREVVLVLCRRDAGVVTNEATNGASNDALLLVGTTEFASDTEFACELISISFSLKTWTVSGVASDFGGVGRGVAQSLVTVGPCSCRVRNADRLSSSLEG